jgi:hypothetical protein
MPNPLVVVATLMPLTATVIGQLRLMATFDVVEKTTLPGVESHSCAGISRAPDHIEVFEKRLMRPCRRGPSPSRA